MSAAYRLEIEIPGVPRLLANYRGGWKATHFEKRKWKNLIMSYVDQPKKPATPLTKAGIRCTRFTARDSDFDNRVSGFKACIDGLVAAGVLVDDNDTVLIERQYPWIKCANKDSRIKIEVWGLE